MTGSIAVSQCGHTPNRPGHHGTVVTTVGSVAISCNVVETNYASFTSEATDLREMGYRGPIGK